MAGLTYKPYTPPASSGGKLEYKPYSSTTPAAVPEPSPKTGIAGFVDGVKNLFNDKKKAAAPPAAVATKLSYKPYSASAAPPPAPPPEPSTVSKVGGVLSNGIKRVSNVISAATAPPEVAPTSTSAFKNTMAYLPSEIVRHLPFGIGPLISQIQDDPETASKIGLKDVAKELPGAVVETAKAFAKMPLQGALDIAGASAQAVTSGKYSGRMHFEVPGLGEVSNAQFRAAERVQNGEDPVVVALEEGASSIFETLFFTDVASLGFRARPVKTAAFKTDGIPRVNIEPGRIGSSKPEIVANMPAAAKVVPGPRTGRLYEQPSVTQALPPSAVARMQQQGINLGPKFDPNLPTYFKVSAKPKGVFVGEVIQLKPSLFSDLVRKVKGKGAVGKESVPDAMAHIASSEGMNVDDAIRKGDIPENMVYQDRAKGILTQQYAAGRIQDVAQKLDRYEKGLGAEFKKTIDPANVTMDGIEKAGLSVLDDALKAGKVELPGLSTTPAAAVAGIPREDVDVLYQREVDGTIAPTPVVEHDEVAPQTPASPEEAADTYYAQVIKPAQDGGGATVIGADDMKDFFGADYNDANHPTYSRAAFLLYEKALKENPGDVILTGGGPASGKTEIIVNELRNTGFTGIIYDSNMANFEGVKKQVEMAHQAGKHVEVVGITPNLESARTFSIQREGTTGRGITDKTFARGHTGFPAVVRQLLEDNILSPKDVNIIDTRHNPSLEEAKGIVRVKGFVEDPLAHVRSLGYNEANVQQQYAKSSFEQGSGKRLAGASDLSQSSGRPPRENRSNEGTEGSGSLAEKDWEENYAEKVAALDAEISAMQARMKEKGVKISEKKALQKKIDALTKESAALEDEWLKKWSGEQEWKVGDAIVIDGKELVIAGKLAMGETKYEMVPKDGGKGFYTNKAGLESAKEANARGITTRELTKARNAERQAEIDGKSAEKNPQKKNTEQFYVIDWDRKFHEYPGKKVDLGIAGEFFIHRPFDMEKGKIIPKTSGWTVSEATSGMSLFSSPSPTQSAAIYAAKAAIEKAGGAEAVEKAVARARETYGTPKEALSKEKPALVAKPRVKDYPTQEAYVKAYDHFVKTGEVLPAYTGGAAGQDVGAFRDDTPIKAGGLDKINPIELPEMVSLARELMGEVPEIRKKLGKALGYFKPGEGNGTIRLRADLFDNVDQVAKILAHEIGHLTDYLPNQTMKRGNLLGRLFTLKRFMASTFDKESGKAVALDKLRKQALNEVLAKKEKTFGNYMEDTALREAIKPEVKERYLQLVDETHAVKNAEIKQELQTVSDYWRPWDKENSSLSYRAYRNSSSELYADALSMLFNSPGLLEEMAPKFYEEFFASLDRKPEVRDAYFELQSLLAGDRELLVKSRREGVQKMFQEGDLKAYELQRQRIAEKKLRNSNILQRLKHELVDKNASIIKRVQELEKAGVVINPDDNPIHFLEERNYLGGKIKYLAEDFNGIYQDVAKAGITWEQFGEALFYQRVAAGDRTEQANPRGITPKAAEELLADMETQMGKEQYAELERNVEAFRGVMRTVTDAAYAEGLYSKEMYDQMVENPAYATFQVLEHLETNVSHKVFKSVGTFKDIANPADATILKTMATIRAIERNKVHRVTIDFLQENFPTEVREADKQFSGKKQTYIESRDPKEELAFVYRDGKAIGYYVDPYIKSSLQNETVGRNLAALSVIRMMNAGVFRPLFIIFSPGFQAFNLIRDFWRTWKNIPGISLPRVVQRYREALPMAKVRGFGLSEKPNAKELAAYEELRSLENQQVFGFTFNDLMDGMPDDEKQIERILRQSGIQSFAEYKPGLQQAIQKVRIIKPVIDLLDLIKRTGDAIETLPKAAGFYELKNPGSTELTADQRSYIRKYLGSPDFLAGGNLKPMTNEIFLFSNAIVQGIRSDLVMASAPKTRSGYWWKTAKVNVLPHLLMAAAVAGFFGKEIKDLLDGASEYDKSNYLVIPLGRDNTGKPVYLRLPQDESGRLIGAVTWKVITSPTNTQAIGKDITDIAGFFGGQLPGVSPAITAAAATGQYLAGQNPYDPFRGREVISQDVFKAGGWRSAQSFLGWMFQELGGGTFVRFYNEPTMPKNAGELEQFFGLPIVANILGRFVRVSDYGKQEALQNITDQVQSKAANQRLDDNDVVNAALKQAVEDPEIANNRAVYEAQIRDTIKGEGPMDEEAQKRFDRARTRFRLGLLKGSADAETAAFLNANTNEEKAAILRTIKSHLEDAEFQEYLAELRRSGMVTPDVINKMKRNEINP